jgi:hypothetical protein
VDGADWQSAQRQMLSTRHTSSVASVGIDGVGRAFVAWFEDDGVWTARFE